MIDSTIFLEKFLQNYRFRVVKSYLAGDVLDFGGNKGELKKMAKGDYVVVNYDHSIMKGGHFDTIVSLAVAEHMYVEDTFKVFHQFKTILNVNGRILITTPAKMAKPILEIWALIGVVDRKNIAEHKHYWNKEELYDLARKTGFVVEKYRKFQLGFNQLAIFKHN